MSPGRAWFRAAAVSSRRISTTPSATPSLDSKWLSTVWWETPAAAAMAASVTSSNGCARNSSMAARAMRSRVAATPSARAAIV